MGSKDRNKGQDNRISRMVWGSENRRDSLLPIRNSGAQEEFRVLMGWSRNAWRWWWEERAGEPESSQVFLYPRKRSSRTDVVEVWTD